MPLPTRITLPASGRPVGGLLSAARSIGGDWWRGVTFSSGQCLAPQVVGTCTDGEVEKVMDELSDPVTFEAFSVLQAVKCSTMGRTDVSTFANESLDTTREFGVAQEFLSGAASGNPSLADATILGSASDPTAALGCIDQYAAQALSGRLAFIHVSPELAVQLFAAAIWRDGRLWRTPLGNVVVVSAGYDGRMPGTAPIEDDDEAFIYATGEVYAEVGQRDTLSAVERSQNTLEAVAEDQALVVFDPCLNVAIATGYQHCALSAFVS